MEEVEQICTRIAIMDKGRNLALGTADELKKLIKNSETVKIHVPELTEVALKELKELPHAYKCEYKDNELTISFSGGKNNLINTLDYLSRHEIIFSQVYSKLPTLNDVFLEITGKELRD